MRNDMYGYDLPGTCVFETVGTSDEPAGTLKVAGGKSVDLYRISENRFVGEWPSERWVRDENWLHVDSADHVHRWKLVGGKWRVTRARFVEEHCDGMCGDPTHTYDSWRCSECGEKIIDDIWSHVGFRKEIGHPDRKPAPSDAELLTRERLPVDLAARSWVPAKLNFRGHKFTGEVMMLEYNVSFPGPSRDDKVKLRWRSRDEPGVIWEPAND